MKALILFALILTACGSEEGSKEDKQGFNEYESSAEYGVAAQREYGSFIEEAKSFLPECNEQMGSALAYVKSVGSFMTCDGKEWEKIDLEGLNLDYYRFDQRWYYVSREMIPVVRSERCPRNHKPVVGDELKAFVDDYLSEKPFWSIPDRAFYSDMNEVYHPTSGLFKSVHSTVKAFTVCIKNTGA